MKIIGVSGKAGSGKDHIFKHYFQPRGFRRVSLADHFKIGLAGKGLATYEEVFHTKPANIRALLQEEGTEKGWKLHGEYIWCETLYNWMKLWAETTEDDKFCITDIRFEHEVRYFKEKNAKIFRIVAPERVENSSLSQEARAHLSETALDTFIFFDDYIANDPVDADTVQGRVNFLLNNYGLE